MANDPLGTAKTMYDQLHEGPGGGLGRLIPELRGHHAVSGCGQESRDRRQTRRRRPPAARPAGQGRPRPALHGRPEQDSRRHGPGRPRRPARCSCRRRTSTLPGILPLVFRRQVESGYRAGRWFGPSWSSTVDQRLEIDAEGVVFVTEDGLLLPTRIPAPGCRRCRAQGPRACWSATPTATTRSPTRTPGRVRHFTATVRTAGTATPARADHRPQRQPHHLRVRRGAAPRCASCTAAATT